MKNQAIRVNTYHVDPAGPHIKIRTDPDPDVFLLLERICPAGLYWHGAGGYHYDYTGCLECGACAVIGGDKVFLAWNYPAGAYGVDRSG